MRLAGFIVAVAACYSPGYQDCEVVCTSGVCPTGLVCELGMCRAGEGLPACGTTTTDAPVASDDRDNDTINNAFDNCPDHANTNQANEDRDPFGDACDPCPPLGMPNDNVDSDGDGVGDGCDLSAGADKIMLFESFLPGMPADVEFSSSGCWSFTNGDAVVEGSAPGACQMLWPRVLGPGHLSYSITTGMNITGSEGPLGSVRRAGILDEADTIDGEAVICEYGIGSNENQSLILFNTVTATTVDSVDADSAIDTPAIARLSLVMNGYTCSALPVAPSIGGPQQLTLQAPKVGFHARGVDVTFAWIMVVSGP